MKKTNLKRYYIAATLIGFFLIFWGLVLYRLSIVLLPYVSIIEYSPKIPVIDDMIPMVSFFIIPYVLAYPYWVITPILIANEDRRFYVNFIFGMFVTYAIGYAIQTVFPTSMDRVGEGLYSLLLARGDLFSKLHYFFFKHIDPGDVVYGLLPSFHCTTTIYCLFGVIESKKMPKWLKISFTILSILIVLSTLFMKQHYFLDLISGCFMGTIMYLLAKKFNWGKLIEPFLAKIDGKDN